MFESSVARGHDGGYRVHINLLRDVPRLDDLLLAGYRHEVVRAHLGQAKLLEQSRKRTNLPAVELYPSANGVLLDQAQKFTQHRFLNGLTTKIIYS